ncbi:unnamed protein product [Clonostachys rosea f. rosea IK726]|uniref:MARVEL domain-containing protein n=2 Tax=Bionectria ochroleuca TaxID=29856 RepID=A0A0B7KAX4_BIOOC|nr:unnamed protein product [Clonostachys rosea f. rosea IK726]
MGFANLDKSYVGFTIAHCCTFALAIAVCGIYGSDIQYARETHKGVNSKWVFAVVVGALSALTCVIYAVPFIFAKGAFFMIFWDAILFILWISLFGVFGSMYIHEDANGDRDVERMKNTVWLDLTNALLWLIITVAIGIYWFKHRSAARTRWSGRMKV